MKNSHLSMAIFLGFSGLYGQHFCQFFACQTNLTGNLHIAGSGSFLHARAHTFLNATDTALARLAADFLGCMQAHRKRHEKRAGVAGVRPRAVIF
jgi:hypothetical protein